jgi:hypothetical protein
MMKSLRGNDSFTKLCKLIFRSNEMSDERRWNILVLIFKNKRMYKVVLIIEDQTNESYSKVI